MHRKKILSRLSLIALFLPLTLASVQENGLETQTQNTPIAKNTPLENYIQCFDAIQNHSQSKPRKGEVGSDISHKEMLFVRANKKGQEGFYSYHKRGVYFHPLPKKPSSEDGGFFSKTRNYYLKFIFPKDGPPIYDSNYPATDYLLSYSIGEYPSMVGGWESLNIPRISSGFFGKGGNIASYAYSPTLDVREQEEVIAWDALKEALRYRLASMAKEYERTIDLAQAGRYHYFDQSGEHKYPNYDLLTRSLEGACSAIGDSTIKGALAKAKGDLEAVHNTYFTSLANYTKCFKDIDVFYSDSKPYKNDHRMDYSLEEDYLLIRGEKDGVAGFYVYTENKAYFQPLPRRAVRSSNGSTLHYYFKMLIPGKKPYYHIYSSGEKDGLISAADRPPSFGTDDTKDEHFQPVPVRELKLGSEYSKAWESLHEAIKYRLESMPAKAAHFKAETILKTQAKLNGACSKIMHPQIKAALDKAKVDLAALNPQGLRTPRQPAAATGTRTD